MSIRWAEPPQQLRLAPNEVHVWRAELQMEDSELARLSASLSPDEQHRATRYRSSADARLFLLARGVLRHILSSYLDATAAELSFRYSAHGKPSLANPGADWLHFNVSHSGTLALVALARDSEIGVDVEQIRPELATWQLATAFFAESEVRGLQQLGNELRADAFFACWTRKEAYLKARGSGLSAALDTFEVSVAVDAACDFPDPVIDGDGHWSLRSLHAGPGFAAACAAQGRDWHTKLWQWSAVSTRRSQAA